MRGIKVGFGMSGNVSTRPIGERMILVGPGGEVELERLRRFDPDHDFIVRQGELVVSRRPRAEVDVIVHRLAEHQSHLDAKRRWTCRPVPVVGGGDPSWVLYRSREHWCGPDESAIGEHVAELEECRRVARTVAGGDDQVDFHAVLGLTPAHGLIGRSTPTRASRDDYHRQRGETSRRIERAAALHGGTRRGSEAAPINIAVIDTGYLPVAEGMVPEYLDSAVDVDADDFEPVTVCQCPPRCPHAGDRSAACTCDPKCSISDAVVGPHVGHAAFVASVVRLAAPADLATIHFERAVEGERMALGVESGGDDYRKAGVITEESIARQIYEVHAEVAAVDGAMCPSCRMGEPCTQNCAADGHTERLHVVNLSLGSYTCDGPPIVLGEAIRALSGCQECCADGLAIVAAAGNDATSRRFYPAAFDEVIAVGALATAQQLDLSSDRRAMFSNYGDWVDCYAPGQNVIGAYVRGVQAGPADEPPARYDGWATWSGTSIAAPFVSGVLAATVEWRRDQADEGEALLGADDLRRWFADEDRFPLLRDVGILPVDPNSYQPVPRRPQQASTLSSRKRTRRTAAM